jgi:4-amino-4-deoxy-L-arabinose transferase-like glycosyltransferase
MGLAATLIFNQLQNEVLYSGDGPAYAVIGKELAHRPFVQWAVLTWNGIPVFEHPHLTPWLLGLSISLMGASTLAALMPVALLSLATVFLAYAVGRRLLDHDFGLLTATVLALTPEFIKGARNPMLEPALMFCIALAIYLHVRSTEPGRLIRDTVLSGLSLGLALLAKGPPALLAVAVIAFFQLAARAPGALARFRLRPRHAALQQAAMLTIAVAVVLSVDAWHRALTGSSFVAHYVAHQLQYTIVEGRGVARNNWTYYAGTFIHDWPWWPLVLAGGAVVAWKRDIEALPALVVGGAITAGTYAGFTLMVHKAEWYTAIHYVGSSMLAALALRPVFSPRLLAAHYRTFVLLITVPLLALSATAPSLFLEYGRPFERFAEHARSKVGEGLAGETVADCVGLDAWKGPFLLRFYLGAVRVDCADPSARFALIDHSTMVLAQGSRLVVSQDPFSIIERPRPAPSPMDR